MQGTNQSVSEEGRAAASGHASKRNRGITLAALLILGGLSYFLWRNITSKPRAPQASRVMLTGGVPLTTAIAKRGNLGIYLEAIGTVTPVYTASITSQVNGMITAVHYSEGQIVHTGDPLIDIDPRPFQAQVKQAEGTLDRDINILAQARMDLERYRDAWARNGIPRQQYEDQQKVVLQDESQVESDQGALEFLRVQLGWSHITAPFSGRVGLRLVDPGNVVVLSASNQINGTTSLVVITQTHPITVVFTLPQDDLSELQNQMRRGPDLPVYAYDRTMDTKLASGELIAIDNQVDTTTGTVKLRAEFRNSDDALFPNQFVNTRLLLKTLKNVTLIPSQAVQRNGQTAFVYVVQDGEARIQNVTTGPTDAGMTAVTGIRTGTVVATSSFEKLGNATPVSPVQTKAPPAPARGPR